MIEKPIFTKYNLSFTAGGLLLTETICIAEKYLKTKSWKTTRTEILENNILGRRTLSTAKRIFSEVELRLSSLEDEDMEKLLEMNTLELQKQLVWIFICNTYRFISDFLAEVVYEKTLSLSVSLENEDYDRFFNKKSQWHEELDRISDSTKGKIKQVLFKMLKEMEILSEENKIIFRNNVNPCAADIAQKYQLKIKEIIPAYSYQEGKSYA
jgi:hypothetical protein